MGYLARLPVSHGINTYEKHYQKLKLWDEMRAWCHQQGWREKYDFSPPGVIDGAWYFLKEEHRNWFLLRWS